MFNSLLLVYFKVWTIAILNFGYLRLADFVLSSGLQLYNIKTEYGERGAPPGMFFLIPTNLNNNNKNARFARQGRFYLHFVITVPVLLFICFMDPKWINFDFENDYGVASLHWAELELSHNPRLKYLAIGLSLGCGIFSVLVDLIFTIVW